MATGPDALNALDELDSGWWAGYVAYDLGRAIERIPTLTPPDPALPDLVLVRYGTRVTVDGATTTVRGGPPLDDLLLSEPRDLDGTGVTGWRSSLDRDSFTTAVGTIRDHLTAGDCYQVNLTRRLTAPAEPDPVALYRRLVQHHPAPHAALVRAQGVAVVSASPERFLRRDGDRIETRPIKGTAADASVLTASAKDRAENVMIVDLARNDLGRVCRYGSVHVPSLCEIEEHPGLYHLVSTVRGRLQRDVGWGDIIRATFPPASVTGCPKPRVLEIIEHLEPVRRGVYCGAVGFIDADNDIADLNVAIRTFTITGGRTTFGVGGGIVADSDPAAEWTETELKASKLLEIAAGEPVRLRGTA